MPVLRVPSPSDKLLPSAYANSRCSSFLALAGPVFCNSSRSRIRALCNCDFEFPVETPNNAAISWCSISLDVVEQENPPVAGRQLSDGALEVQAVDGAHQSQIGSTELPVAVRRILLPWRYPPWESRSRSFCAGASARRLPTVDAARWKMPSRRGTCGSCETPAGTPPGSTPRLRPYFRSCAGIGNRRVACACGKAPRMPLSSPFWARVISSALGDEAGAS